MEVLKKHYGEPRLIVEAGKSKLIPPILDSWQLDLQQAYFMVAMINNPKLAMEKPLCKSTYTVVASLG